MYFIRLKNKPTNVGINLERQAGRKTFDPNGIQITDLPIHNHMHWPLGYLTLVFALLQPTLY